MENKTEINISFFALVRHRETHCYKMSLSIKMSRLMIIKGDLAALKKIFEYKSNINYSEAFILAASEGHLHICKWLLRLPKKYRIDPAADNNYAFELASKNGHLDVCKWLLRLPKRYGIKPMANRPFNDAISKGHLDICIWLISLPKEFGIDPAAPVTPGDYRSFVLAAKHGHLHICKWLMTLPERFRIDPTTENNEAFNQAGINGHLDVCKWLWSLRRIFEVYPLLYAHTRIFKFNATLFPIPTSPVQKWLLSLPEYILRVTKQDEERKEKNRLHREKYGLFYPSHDDDDLYWLEDYDEPF